VRGPQHKGFGKNALINIAGVFTVTP
jgi:hypothetical protein